MCSASQLSSRGERARDFTTPARIDDPVPVLHERRPRRLPEPSRQRAGHEPRRSAADIAADQFTVTGCGTGALYP
jgi:hypothetical protein